MPRNLNEVLIWEIERVVQRDCTVQSEGKRYQLERRHEAMSLAGLLRASVGVEVVRRNGSSVEKPESSRMVRR